MNIENPLAYSFILQDDIYLLNADKLLFETKEQLIVETVTVEQTPAPAFKYLGGHKKQYLIITHYPDADFIAPDHLTALESTLKRLGYEREDIAIFNMAAHPGTELQQVTDFFKPQKMLMLGGSALPAGLGALQQNKAQAVGNSNCLFTFSFNEMMDNNANKKVFWEAMKTF